MHPALATVLSRQDQVDHQSHSCCSSSAVGTQRYAHRTDGILRISHDVVFCFYTGFFPFFLPPASSKVLVCYYWCKANDSHVHIMCTNSANDGILSCRPVLNMDQQTLMVLLQQMKAGGVGGPGGGGARIPKHVS